MVLVGSPQLSFGEILRLCLAFQRSCILTHVTSGKGGDGDTGMVPQLPATYRASAAAEIILATYAESGFVITAWLVNRKIGAT